ncbi:capsule polysaccharide modification protein [Catenovulum agarivorans DS-2]|uniref:Capsule polysaccharide modification protein n=1 Tax=Catenovulum agarivorans DS-2 TaxID=1328313 RepID=W7QQY3_9ALTE|nr:capsular polysaccharide biosynthesis protein [Catenovulum agarivorans]EWH10283.1 capsule polysaccharide modification protein [Catenovulum agarivorans DS-2]
MILLTSFGLFKKRNNIQCFCATESLETGLLLIVWGLKKRSALSNLVIRALSSEVPTLRLEDGFIGYLNHPTAKSNLLSLSVDTTGIYYDATNPSDMEAYIAAGIPQQFSARLNLSNDEFVSNRAQQNLPERVKAFRQSLIDNQITKYNLCGQVEQAPQLAENAVLVIDQTFGDLSVEYSYASADSFKQMLQAAIAENPTATIYVKAHPDVLLGKKTGFIKPEWTNCNRVQFIYQACNPIALIQQVSKVYTVCSQMGFEALLNNKPVVTFGAPFYAGWGLTDDRGHIPQRRQQLKAERQSVSIDDLVYAAYFCYVRYVNPLTQQRCDPEDIVEFIQLQKTALQFNTIYCCNFSLWKKAFLPYFLRKYAKKVVFVTTNQLKKIKPQQNDALLLWGAKAVPEHAPVVLKNNLLRIEDGFIRSVGLGADLRRPSSLVVDNQGIYFNPQHSSRLEDILQNKCFSPIELERADKLIQLLNQSKVSKYNVEDSANCAISPKAGQKIVLVVGQVEDDASIQTGCPDISTNLGLLQQVRKLRPDDYIIYKPHPDVLTGNRVGNIAKDTVNTLADIQIEQASIIQLIEQCDELHTLSSLSGFEALLRGKQVYCYGLPFYAGWGLTCDALTISRRNRNLSLAELVHATLIDYPDYIDWQSGFYTKPELIVQQFAGKSEKLAAQSQINTFLLRKWRKIRFVFEALLVNRFG